jgi:hypothetical protein
MSKVRWERRLGHCSLMVGEAEEAAEGGSH